MMRAAERQVGEIEQRLAGSGQALGERERDARTLALLAKTLQSLTALDALHEPKAGRRNRRAQTTNDDHDRSPPALTHFVASFRDDWRAWPAGDPGRISGEADE